MAPGGQGRAQGLQPARPQHLTVCPAIPAAIGCGAEGSSGGTVTGPRPPASSPVKARRGRGCGREAHRLRQVVDGMAMTQGAEPRPPAIWTPPLHNDRVSTKAGQLHGRAPETVSDGLPGFPRRCARQRSPSGSLVAARALLTLPRAVPQRGRRRGSGLRPCRTGAGLPPVPVCSLRGAGGRCGPPPSCAR